jgi:hypothetical protein
MRNTYPDGQWKFSDVGLHIHGGFAGSHSGRVETEDGEIGTIWLNIDMPDGSTKEHPIAPGSFLHATILPQITRDLPAMIDWQSGGRANLTATSRAQTRALVTP